MPENKKVLFLLPALAILLALFLTACQDENKNQYKLKLAHFFPASHPAETILIKEWSQAVNEATGGQVVIESYPGESLAKAADIYNSVVAGVADIGLSCYSYTPGRFPVMEAFELPGVSYNNSRAASMVAWEGARLLEPVEIQDTHLLMLMATGPGDLFSKTPIRSLADLAGQEVRATGISAETISLLGGVPVGMPQSDTYDALAKGVVKANLSPVEVLKGWKHAEVTNYITRTPFVYNTLFFVAMNQDSWASLPQDLQLKIDQVSSKFQEETAASLWDRQNETALAFALEEQNMQIIELAPAETELWLSKVRPLQTQHQMKLAGLGLDSDPFSLIAELAEKYNQLYD